jgi:hypothetical protein
VLGRALEETHDRDYGRLLERARVKWMASLTKQEPAAKIATRGSLPSRASERLSEMERGPIRDLPYTRSRGTALMRTILSPA